MKRLLQLAPLLFVFAPGIHAEVSELAFRDTLNADKYVTPDKVWLNPATGFDALVISGLDRYVELKLQDSKSATVWSARSTKVTVDDRLKTSTGTEFYGKRISVPAVAEGNYILQEIVYDLQNKEVSRTSYPMSIDRTAPATGVITYTRSGWQQGSEAAFTSIVNGMQYAGVQALVFKGLADDDSGLDRAEYFTVDPNRVERKKNAALNFVDGSVTVQIAEAANATITPIPQGEYQIGVYVYDKAGNRAELSRTSSVDMLLPWMQFQVLNEKDGTWSNYTPNMTVYTNPIKIRTLRRKSDFTSVNGTHYGWNDSTFQTSDAEYNIYTYNYVYPNNSDSYYDFQTYAGGIRRVVDSAFKFTVDPGMDLAPKRISYEMHRGDTDEWLPSSSIWSRTFSITGFRATMEPRAYAQKIRTTSSPSFNCIIPAGSTSCEMTTTLNYVTPKGAATIYLYAGKTDSAIYDTKIGSYVLIWDSNPPVINSATVSKADKSILMTVIDNDRVNTTELNKWDTKIFNATLKDANGKETVLNPKSWNESDFKTKNAIFSYANLPDGRYTVESVSATDNVGNTGTKELHEEILLDSIAPAISFSYLGGSAEGKLIKGLENLVITMSDASGDAQFTSLNLSGGPNKENVSLTTIKTGTDTYTLEYPRLFPAQTSDDGSYKLTVDAIDGSGNRSSKVLNFLYEPDNLIVLDRMQTLGTATALKTSDNQPLAFVRTSQLRSKDGSIITGQISGTLSVRKDSHFPVTIAGVTVAPGETKEIVLDMGQGEDKLFPVTPGINGVSGSATFSINFAQI
ncbi:Conjugative transfer protein 123 [Enterobacter hormaechei]|uniref:Ig-like domain-containing protein n=1 Tax=Enterobacter hormaechei TaxID=158836 RepID=UPI0012531C76|nr:Ig-like domain-containing protein [Enterobacter hormaechei]VAE21531.1 Conjugative transfer protein 123 [Enterobacter hormaechei]VAE27080.1 Conjugative transfer protein 123 [Enterobacter hormaechei]